MYRATAEERFRFPLALRSLMYALATRITLKYIFTFPGPLFRRHPSQLKINLRVDSLCLSIRLDQTKSPRCLQRMNQQASERRLPCRTHSRLYFCRMAPSRCAQKRRADVFAHLVQARVYVQETEQNPALSGLLFELLVETAQTERALKDW